MPFLKALAWNETQTHSSRIWIRVTDSIFYDNILLCYMYFLVLCNPILSATCWVNDFHDGDTRQSVREWDDQQWPCLHDQSKPPWWRNLGVVRPAEGWTPAEDTLYKSTTITKPIYRTNKRWWNSILNFMPSNRTTLKESLLWRTL